MVLNCRTTELRNCELRASITRPTIKNSRGAVVISSAVIVGTGIDIVEVPRVAAALTRFGGRFERRVFTEAEIRYCRSKPNADERFAARFAAKEAALKALGTGWRGGIAWRDVEVRRESGGRPTIGFT